MMRDSPVGRTAGCLLLGALLLVLAAQTTPTEAKRGCANFGHSCYGGMGKRANAASDELAGGADPALVFEGPRGDERMSPYLQQLLRFYRNMQRRRAAAGRIEQ